MQTVTCASYLRPGKRTVMNLLRANDREGGPVGRLSIAAAASRGNAKAPISSGPAVTEIASARTCMRGQAPGKMEVGIDPIQ